MSWVYVPQCSHCVPATEDSNWGSEQLASILASSVTWRGKPSPPQTWLRRFKRRPWIRLLSGLTCGHSTHGPLQGSICSSQGSRVSRGAPQEGVRVSMMSDGSGQTLLALSASVDPAPSSSNAPPASERAASPSCSSPLPMRGTMLRGRVTSLPPRQERHIVGRGSSWSRGMYPTPTASRYGSSQNGINGKGGEKERPSAGTPSLATWAQMWPTPTLDPMRSRSGARKGERTLHKMAKNWPTPAASDSRSSGRHTTQTGVMHAGTSLTDAMRQWPTPCARDHKGGNLKPYSERGGGTKGEQLPNFVRHHFHPAQTTPTDGSDTSQKAVLHPAFLEALMGIPTGWTGFVSQVME